MRHVFRPLLGAGLLLAACSHVTPEAHHVVTPASNVAVAPALRPVVPAPSPSASPGAAAPRLSGAQSGQTLADGSHLPAVQGLLMAADRSLRTGDTEGAAMDLERAQRLAPQSAAVYQRLADVRLRQKRAPEAEQLARKGLALAVGAAQQAAFWRQIAAARQQQGMIQAAQEALARAAALDGRTTP